MVLLKLARAGLVTALLLTSASMGGVSRAQSATETASACSAAPMATATAEATDAAALTPEATPEVTPSGDAPLVPVSFVPTDIHFNPSAEAPFALITVYSLVFQSQSAGVLHIEKPHFQLAIDGVPWGELVSTDFQTGQLMPHATQGIVLQNLTIIAKSTPEQQRILECLKAGQSVDVTLTGTLDAYPNGVKQAVDLTLTTPQVVFSKHGQAAS